MSISKVNQILARKSHGEGPKSPIKHRKKLKQIAKIDNFTQDAIRNVIYDMYANSKYEYFVFKFSSVASSLEAL